MIERILDYLKNNDVEYREQVRLSEMSSIRIGGISELVVYPKNVKELVDLIRYCVFSDIPYRVAGRLTNILFCGDVTPCIIVKTDRIDTKRLAENELTLGCGVRLSSAIHWACTHELGGMEKLAHIPGSVGGMIYNNAGAYGISISDLLVYAHVYLPREDRIVCLDRGGMEFDYRDSILKHNGGVLLSAAFELERRLPDDILREIGEYKKLRFSSQPVGMPSLGSVFLRSYGVSAGKLIDLLGLRGYRIGGASVSEKHAGFIVNSGGATSYDVLELIKFIKEKVYSAFGICLSLEIEII